MKKLKFKTIEHFTYECESNPTIISDAILYSIKNNTDTEINELSILDIEFENTDEILELFLPRKDIINTLEMNLKFYIEEEKYETCLEIQDIINKFK